MTDDMTIGLPSEDVEARHTEPLVNPTNQNRNWRIIAVSPRYQFFVGYVVTLFSALLGLLLYVGFHETSVMTEGAYWHWPWNSSKQHQDTPDCANMPLNKGYCMSWKCAHWILASVGLSFAAICAIVFAALPAIGFGAAGITEGSIAASWQSMIGNVSAGSVFAILTSIGMAGLSGATLVSIPASSAVTAQALCDFFTHNNATATA